MLLEMKSKSRSKSNPCKRPWKGKTGAIARVKVCKRRIALGSALGREKQGRLQGLLNDLLLLSLFQEHFVEQYPRKARLLNDLLLLCSLQEHFVERVKDPCVHEKHVLRKGAEKAFQGAELPSLRVIFAPLCSE